MQCASHTCLVHSLLSMFVYSSVKKHDRENSTLRCAFALVKNVLTKSKPNSLNYVTETEIFTLPRIVCVDKVLQTKKHHILDSITFYKMIPLIQCLFILFLSSQVNLFCPFSSIQRWHTENGHCFASQRSIERGRSIVLKSRGP